MTRCAVTCCAPHATHRVEPDPTGSKDTCILVFSAGPPYEDIAFRIVNKEWETTQRWGRSTCRYTRAGIAVCGARGVFVSRRMCGLHVPGVLPCLDKQRGASTNVLLPQAGCTCSPLCRCCVCLSLQAWVQVHV
jgi:hypothetical protein